ncbi:hypothetical protein J6590_010059 [Homalodisca vitripennis]|nr:hypothetical protein J6590_010059 [Homalodisca vitripennis]
MSADLVCRVPRTASLAGVSLLLQLLVLCNTSPQPLPPVGTGARRSEAIHCSAPYRASDDQTSGFRDLFPEVICGSDFLSAYGNELLKKGGSRRIGMWNTDVGLEKIQFHLWTSGEDTTTTWRRECDGQVVRQTLGLCREPRSGFLLASTAGMSETSTLSKP